MMIALSCVVRAWCAGCHGLVCACVTVLCGQGQGRRPGHDCGSVPTVMLMVLGTVGFATLALTLSLTLALAMQDVWVFFPPMREALLQGVRSVGRACVCVCVREREREREVVCALTRV